MLWFRMLSVVLRLSWPYVLTPWRSPLVRWRLETFGVTDRDGRLLHADQITPQRYVRFLITRRKELARFLRWAALL